MTLSDTQVRTMTKHAEACYPGECCGIIGRRAADLVLFPAQNLSRRNDEFLLDPKALLATRTQGFEIVGFYHSHPDGPAHMSPKDCSNQIVDGQPTWPGIEHWVLSVCAGQTVDLKRFVWNPSRTRYEERGHGCSVPEDTH